MDVRRVGLMMPVVAAAGWLALQSASPGADPVVSAASSVAVAESSERVCPEAADSLSCPFCSPPLAHPRDLRREIERRLDAFLERHADLQEGWWDDDWELDPWEDEAWFPGEAYPPRVSSSASSGDEGGVHVASSVAGGNGLAVALSYADGLYQIQVSYPTAEGSVESRVHGDLAEVEAWLATLPARVQRAVRRQLEGTGAAPQAACDPGSHRARRGSPTPPKPPTEGVPR